MANDPTLSILISGHGLSTAPADRCGAAFDLLSALA